MRRGLRCAARAPSPGSAQQWSRTAAQSRRCRRRSCGILRLADQRQRRKLRRRAARRTASNWRRPLIATRGVNPSANAARQHGPGSSLGSFDWPWKRRRALLFQMRGNSVMGNFAPDDCAGVQRDPLVRDVRQSFDLMCDHNQRCTAIA